MINFKKYIKPKGWNNTAIENICEIISGYSAPQNDEAFYNGTVPFVRMKDLGNIHLSNNFVQAKDYLNENFVEKNKFKIAKKGTLILPRTGSVSLNHRAVLGFDAVLVNHIFGLKLSVDYIDNKFLYYFLCQFDMKNIMNKTTGLDQITFEKVKKIQIYFPDLDQQKRFVAILDKADVLRQKRKQALALLDELLRSTFLEMFGDLFFNSKNWKIVNLGEIISLLTDYHANGSYEILREHVQLLNKPDYALMVRTTDLESKKFLEGVKYISKSAYEFLEKSKVYGGEIIFNKIGSAGKVYLMPNLHRPVSLGMNQFMVRFKKNINNIFMYHLLKSKYGDAVIQKKVQGAVTKTIRKDAIRSLKMPLPPTELQTQFAKIVEQTEATKAKMQQSLQELENQFLALMQRTFKGEL